MDGKDNPLVTGLRLDDLVLLGRTFDEYRRMFDLDAVDPTLSLLDVASGVSSFSAEAATAGYQVTASDRIYRFPPREIARKCAQDLTMVLDQLPGIKELYLWSYFRDIDELRWRRQQAYLRFVDDFKRYGWQRYVPTEYPRTTFTNGQFALALVSHFLFLYDRQLTYEFHKHTVAELLRITSQEIRIFPLIGLNGRRSPFLERLLHDPMLARCYSKIQSVDYEFMRGGNEMLVISKRPLPR